MEIRTNSWHYWLITHLTRIDEPSRSLCVYFWQVVLSLAAGLLGLVTLTGVFLFPMVLIGIVSPVEGTLVFKLVLTPFILGGFVWFGAIMFGFAVSICFCISWIYEKISERGVENSSKEPNIFVGYVKAKKQKVCPTLKFVEK